tara:strand:+ start:645 stop:1010 length:366 start_codon:yes stop_codon:yes gene_type:complete
MYRGDTKEVSQEWINEHRAYLKKNRRITVEGDEGVTVDEGNDGLPDEGWTKKDITAWLKDKGVSIKGYATKAKLLDKVKTTLNPPAPEPVVEEVAPEPVAEEVVEETIVEDPIVEADGVEE